MKHNALGGVASGSQCPTEGEERLLFRTSAVGVVTAHRVDVPFFAVLVEVGTGSASVAKRVCADGDDGGVLGVGSTAIGRSVGDEVQSAVGQLGRGVSVARTGQQGCS